MAKGVHRVEEQRHGKREEKAQIINDYSIGNQDHLDVYRNMTYRSTNCLPRKKTGSNPVFYFAPSLLL